MITSTISTIELVWLALVTPGLVYSVLLILSTARDAEAIEAAGHNGVARIYTRSTLRQEVRRLVAHGAFVAAGVGAAFEAPSPADELHAIDLAIVGLLFLAAIATTWNTIDAYYTSRHMSSELGRDVVQTDSGRGS